MFYAAEIFVKQIMADRHLDAFRTAQKQFVKFRSAPKDANNCTLLPLRHVRAIVPTVESRNHGRNDRGSGFCTHDQSMQRFCQQQQVDQGPRARAVRKSAVALAEQHDLQSNG